MIAESSPGKAPVPHPVMRRYKPSIAVVVVLVLVVIITLLLAVFLVYTNASDRRQQVFALEKNLTVTIDQAAAALSQPVWDVDDKQTDKILDALMTDIELYGVTLQRSVNDPAAPLLGRVRDHDWKVVPTKASVSSSGVLFQERNVISPKKNETIGILRIYETPRYMEDRLHDSVIRNVFFVIICDLALVLALYGTLWLIVLRPLRAIERYAQKVQSGGTAEIDGGGIFRGELRSLRESIENMVLLLDTRYTTLQKHENMLAAVLNAIPQGVFWKDRESVYLGCNRRFATAVGAATPDLVVGKTDFDMPWSRDEANNYRVHDRDVLNTGKPKNKILEPIQQADGKRLWVETTKVPLLDSEQRVYGLLGIYEDITDRKKAQEAIAAERDFNALLINSTPAFYVALGRGGNIISINHTMCEALGYTTDEVIGKNYLDMFVPRDEHEHVRGIFSALMNLKNTTFNENHVIAKDGRLLLCQWHGTPIMRDGQLEFFIGMGIDITERDAAERRLLRQAAFDAMAREVLAGLVAGGPELNLDTHVRGSLQRIAQFVGAHLAYIADFNPTTRAWSVTHFWNDSGVEGHLLELREVAGMAQTPVERNLLDGETVSVRDLANLPPGADEVRRCFVEFDFHACLYVPLRQSDGHVHGCMGFFSRTINPPWTSDEVQRITLLCSAFGTTFDRLKAEAALRASERRFRELIEQAPVAIALSRDGVYEYRNPANLRIFGLSPSEANVRCPILDRIAPESHEQIKQNIQSRALGNSSDLPYEVKGLRADGTVFPLAYVVAQAELADGPVIISFVTDLTERKRAEALMLESEKLRTVAGLAAGVAHEINNPLAAMVQNAQVAINRFSENVPANRAAAERLGLAFDAMRKYVEEREILESLEAIRVSGRQASRIVQNLLTYSRRDGSTTAVPLCRIIDQTLELAGSDYELKRPDGLGAVEIQRIDAPNEVSAICHASQIQQVLINLIRNAIQAMQANPPERAKYLRLKTFEQDGFACISVEDSGPGMTEEVRRRVFEPFVTTKSTGTGLGLFVCYHIITVNHRGSIQVDSTLNGGTIFTIMLPAKKG